jgi:hypothetical protein
MGITIITVKWGYIALRAHFTSCNVDYNRNIASWRNWHGTMSPQLMAHEVEITYISYCLLQEL